MPYPTIPKRKRAKHTRRRGPPKDPTGPCYIERLPLELLSEIFTLCERDERRLGGSEIPVDESCAVRFSLVNRFWRRAALCTPALWTTVCISTNHHMHRAVRWMERSKRRNLTVTMFATHPVTVH
ncbi:hypothetical protein DACRYDRAFT_94075 [Dacryopinax primogenitus]|uniref:F-box domain-containing protein n=1 Tax=Dacryopinax primogenitus (strain DJM 731) TaxID=1858805 RepID=M5G6Q7_DACPD|nr:uncharacterized protein DACRYDRAFT_94075 [Dacryopinax primogenitus]EJU03890.1 hypothetical protein DACRYDRAFT_94075 [Dacryopinax primogenitus]